MGISEQKIFIVGELHPPKRHPDARITDKLHGEESKLKYQQMAGIRLWFREGSRESNQLSFLILADAAPGMVSPGTGPHSSYILPRFSPLLAPHRRVLTCTMTVQRPTRAPRPRHPWLLGSSLWPWKQSKAQKASNHHY